MRVPAGSEFSDGSGVVRNYVHIENLPENEFSKCASFSYVAVSRDPMKGRRECNRGKGNFRTSAFNVETLTINRRQPARHVAVKR